MIMRQIILFPFVFLLSMRADPTHGTTECWMVDFTWFACGLPKYQFFLVLGCEKRAYFWAFFEGTKSPILARGHMGKTAVFNQIVLYLETPKRDNMTPSRPLQALTPICQNKKGPPRPFGPI